MKRVRVLTQLAAALALTVTAAPAAHSAPAARSTSDVWRFDDGAVVTGGASKLVRTGQGLSLSLRTAGLPANDAVTSWWVIFNHPEACQGAEGEPFRCAGPDLDDPAVAASVQYAGGNVVGEAGSYGIGAYLREGDCTGCPFEELCAGLIDARKADVHLVVRTHGPRLSQHMPEQITSFEGACTPQSSAGLGDGPNTCANLQFAVHETR
jgi:hypothetical protein